MKSEQLSEQWELFCDSSFFDMFCVRPKGDRDFNSPRSFHFETKEDAEKFKELIEKSYHAVKSIL